MATAIIPWTKDHINWVWFKSQVKKLGLDKANSVIDEPGNAPVGKSPNLCRSFCRQMTSPGSPLFNILRTNAKRPGRIVRRELVKDLFSIMPERKMAGSINRANGS